MRASHPVGDDRFIEVGGVRLAVRTLHVTTDRHRPWLVFLHEGLGSIEQWRSFPHRLAAALDRNALVYDRQGHGRSDPLTAPRPFTYHRHEAAVLDSILDEVGIASAILFGHSDGGTIALLAAAARPDRTTAVVAEAAHVVVEEEGKAGIHAARQRFTEGSLRDRLYRYHGARVDTMFAAWADTWLDPAFAEWSIEDDLGSVTAPTLVIQGANDHYASRGHVDLIARRLGGPVETWLVAATGHVPHLEREQDVVRRVGDFLTAYA